MNEISLLTVVIAMAVMLVSSIITIYFLIREKKIDARIERLLANETNQNEINETKQNALMSHIVSLLDSTKELKLKVNNNEAEYKKLIEDIIAAKTDNSKLSEQRRDLENKLKEKEISLIELKDTNRKLKEKLDFCRNEFNNILEVIDLATEMNRPLYRGFFLENNDKGEGKTKFENIKRKIPRIIQDIVQYNPND